MRVRQLDMHLLKPRFPGMFRKSFVCFDVGFQHPVVAMTGEAFERQKVKTILRASSDGTSPQTVPAEITFNSGRLPTLLDDRRHRPV